MPSATPSRSTSSRGVHGASAARGLAQLALLVLLLGSVLAGPATAAASGPAEAEAASTASGWLSPDSLVGGFPATAALPPSDPVQALRHAGALAGVDLERVDALVDQHLPDQVASTVAGSAQTRDVEARARAAHAALANVTGRDASSVEALWMASGDALDAHPPLMAALEEAFVTVAAAHALATTAVAGIDGEDRARLRELAAAWETSRRSGERTPLDEAWSDRNHHLDAIDRDATFAAALLLTITGTRFAERMAASPWPDALPWPAPGSSFAGTSASTCLTDGAGILMLCGPGKDVSEGDHMVLLDLGGSDAHASNAGASGLDVLWMGNNGLPLALAVDLGGDDDYNRAANAQGAGSSTPGVLLDLGGDDTYTVTDQIGFAQGAGNLGGVGFAFDLGGDDRWLHEAAIDDGGDRGPGWDTIGFGILGGIGIAWDVLGDDEFHGGLMSQGVGDFQAFGLLVDGSGNDLHVARRFAQGFGDGAGLGLMMDLLGDDDHVLRDRAGQGYGIGGFGGFVDATGDDSYVAGSSRARGAVEEGPLWKPLHDLVGSEFTGKGLFIDGNGSDSYQDGQGCDSCIWGLGDGFDL